MATWTRKPAITPDLVQTEKYDDMTDYLDKNFTLTDEPVTGIKGGIKVNTTRITSADSPYTVLVTDHKISCNTSGGAITVLLPAGVDGTEYTFKNTTTSNLVTVTPNGLELLDGTNASKSFGKGVLDLGYETTEGWQ